MARNVIVGAKINALKLARAKELRKEMTAGEIALWNCLRSNQLNGLHFRRQQVIDGLIVDFYCHAASLVVEVDGSIHEQQPEYDAERDKILSARGLRILHIYDEEVKTNINGVLQRILAACHHRAL